MQSTKVKKFALVTGSSGLIGSESVSHLCSNGYDVIGIDNNLREFFFGKEASTSWNTSRLSKLYSNNFKALNIDIRDYDKLEKIFKDISFDLIIHAAAQPSHDWAAKDPQTDFSVNANGTLNLLELTKNYRPNATFIFTSTNKVYGDNPNKLPLTELTTRYEVLRNCTWSTRKT